MSDPSKIIPPSASGSNHSHRTQAHGVIRPPASAYRPTRTYLNLFIHACVHAANVPPVVDCLAQNRVADTADYCRTNKDGAANATHDKGLRSRPEAASG